MSLPQRGPWPHQYFETASEHLDVRFRDAEGTDRLVRTHHKVAGTGPPLVVVHGLMTSSYSWRYVIGPLSARYRVMAPDLPGAGSTGAPPDLVYSVGNMARFLTSYVEALGIDAPYLVGNSLGGLHCLAALLDSPDMARRFVLMHSPGYPMAAARASQAVLSLPGAGAAAAWLVRTFADALVARGVRYHRTNMMSREEVREYGGPLRRPEGARVFVRALRESLDPAEHAAVMAKLRRAGRDGIRCPVLLLFSRRDALVPPAFGPRFVRDIPGSTLRWVGDSSHFIQVDQPERTVAELLAFDAQS